MSKGKIVQVMGPVVDVVFEDGDLPDIKDALEVENNGKKCVMEVSQHLGNDVVRCIMLSASEGLQRRAVDLRVIFDNETQTGHTVGHCCDVVDASQSRHNGARQRCIILGHRI